MSAELPLARPEPSLTDIVVGAPVRGRTARELAHLLHWCRAHGMQVVPGHRPGVEVAGTPVTLSYQTEPQGHAIARVWCFVVSQPEPFTGATTPVRMSVTLPNAEGHPVGASATIGIAELAGTVLVEELTAKSDDLETLTIVFEREAGTATATVESVSCFELPRAVLTQNDFYDRGVDLERCQAGQAIYTESLSAIAEGLARTWPRRTLFEWAGADLEVDSGSFVDLFVLPIPALPHRTLRADTVTTCRWTVRYRTEAGTSGEVRITTGIDGTTDTIALADLASAAFVTYSEIDLRCEDPGTEDGLPAGGWETVQVAVRVTGGSGSIFVSAVAVWEPVSVDSFLLQEDGSYLLQEDGSRIKLES